MSESQRTDIMKKTFNAKNNCVDVCVQDQSTELIDLHLGQEIQTITIVTNTNINDEVVTIGSGVAPTVGNQVCFKEGSSFYQGEILSFSPNGGDYDVTLDTPLDFAFTTAGGCREKNTNLAVNGSITPIEFTVTPDGLQQGTKWDIVRFMLQIIATTAMDDGRFGGIDALTKGIVVRHVDGITKNIFNAKTNGDLKSHMYDLTYSDKAPAGQNGLTARRTFGGQNKNGVVIRLFADTGDTFKIIIQDDLTGLTDFQVVVQGHVVED